MRVLGLGYAWGHAVMRPISQRIQQTAIAQHARQTEAAAAHGSIHEVAVYLCNSSLSSQWACATDDEDADEHKPTQCESGGILPCSCG